MLSRLWYRVRVGWHLLRAYLVTPADRPHLDRWLQTLQKDHDALLNPVPWMTYSAVARIAGALGPESRVFEYGCGSSTLWLAARVGHLVSVEHNDHWYRRMSRELRERSVGNVDLLLRQPAYEMVAKSGGRAGHIATGADWFEEYISVIADFPDESFDVVIVDGRSRIPCLSAARSKVKPGGLIVLDDSDRERYHLAGDILAEWPREDYRGIKPGLFGQHQTSVWTKPV